jgi:hypothetical protein
MELLEGTPVLCKQRVAGSIPATSTNLTQCENLRRKHYGARYLKGFKTATSKCAKSPFSEWPR